MSQPRDTLKAANHSTTDLVGLVDIHVHTSPDLVERHCNDLEQCNACRQAGMRALVLKSHHFPTTDRAIIAQEFIGTEIKVLGGIALNDSTSGGLNVAAVQAHLALGARIVWMPTVSARHHFSYLQNNTNPEHIRALSRNVNIVSIFDAKGDIDRRADEIFRLVADYDAVLASGHLSPTETQQVFDRARQLGVTRLLANHVDEPIIGMTLDQQKQLATDGAMLERSCLSILGSVPPADMLTALRVVGAESTILSSDLGQLKYPPPTEGLRTARQLLVSAGLTEAEWQLIASINPSRLLRLESN